MSLSNTNTSNMDYKNEIHHSRGEYSKTCFLCDLDYKKLEIKDIPFRCIPIQKNITKSENSSNNHIFRFLLCPYCSVIFETYREMTGKIKYVTGSNWYDACKSIDKKEIEQFYIDYSNSSE